MGRKIPGKKHKGVKDPHLQHARKEESLKFQINAPPKDVDFQEIPKSLERLIQLKQMTKEGIFDKQKKKKERRKKLMDTSKLTTTDNILPGMTKPDRNIPQLVQRQRESNKAFLHRVSQATYEFIKEVNFEVKHNMKMKRNEKTGEVRFDKVEIHPVDKMFQDKLMDSKSKKKKFKNKNNTSEEKLSKTARRCSSWLQEKKDRFRELEGEGEDKKEDYNQFQDKVGFNEVVDRPPQLTILPRKANTNNEGIARRPARKPGLLLTKMLFTGGEKRDLTGRRKDLSMCDRRKLESAQAEAISAYREIKSKRLKF